MRGARLVAIGVLGLAAALTRAAAPTDVVLLQDYRHIRLGETREWANFPAQGAPALVLQFTTSANPRERTLRVTYRDVKADWRVHLNDREIGRLDPDEAQTVAYLAIPPGTLTNGTNTLRIDGRGAAPDDVLVGHIRLIDRPRAELMAEATIDVAVVEAPDLRGVPSRITVADSSGSLVPLGNESDASHAVRTGVVYTQTGTVRLRLPADQYHVYAGRGFEYSLADFVVDVRRGQTIARRLVIRREVDTTGWAAMDTHVHTGAFAKHGDATLDERLLTLAGEGIELPVSTEHNTRVDFDARARATGVRPYFTPILGTEVTTPALGHFNVFPIPAAGREIDQKSPDWTQLGESIAAAADRPMVVLNHARDEHGGFRPFGSDRYIGVAGEDLDGWRLPANAMEILNSGAVMTDALALTRDWMGLLNRGIRLTPVGSSDSHDVTLYIVGQGRTYVRCDDRDPGAIDTAQVMDSLRRGQVMVSYGLLAEIDVDGKGPGELMGPPRDDLAVHIRVQSPGWLIVRHVALYMDGAPIREEEIPWQRYIGADAPKPGVRWEATWRVPRPTHDVHLVAVATGPGVTAAHWPTARPYQRTSPEFTPYVLGVSGAVFVDADGSGAFDSARDYARRAIVDTTDPAQLASALGRYDAAVATQAASLLRARDAAGFQTTIAAMLRTAPPKVASGLQAYLDALPATRVTP